MFTPKMASQELEAQYRHDLIRGQERLQKDKRIVYLQGTAFVLAAVAGSKNTSTYFGVTVFLAALITVARFCLICFEQRRPFRLYPLLRRWLLHLDRWKILVVRLMWARDNMAGVTCSQVKKGILAHTLMLWMPVATLPHTFEDTVWLQVVGTAVALAATVGFGPTTGQVLDSVAPHCHGVQEFLRGYQSLLWYATFFMFGGPLHVAPADTHGKVDEGLATLVVVSGGAVALLYAYHQDVWLRHAFLRKRGLPIPPELDRGTLGVGGMLGLLVLLQALAYTLVGLFYSALSAARYG